MKLTGLVGFALILSKIELKDLGRLLHQVDIRSLLAAIPLFFIVIAVKTCRWQAILQSVGANLSFFGLLRAYFASFYLGAVTPGRIGEFTKFYYVKAQGISLHTSLYSVLLDRVWDLAFLFVIGYIGVLLFLAFFTSKFILIVLVLLSSFVLLLLIKNDKIRTYIKHSGMQVLQKLLPVKYSPRAEKIVEYWGLALKQKSPRTILIISLCTLISWTTYYYQLYILARGLLIPLAFLHLVIFVSIAALLSMIPITVSGIGIRDVTLIYLFRYVNLSSESAVAFSLAILFLFMVHALIGLFFWIFYPLHNLKINNAQV